KARHGRNATKFCEVTEQNDSRCGSRSAASSQEARSRPLCRAAPPIQGCEQVKATCASRERERSNVTRLVVESLWTSHEPVAQAKSRCKRKRRFSLSARRP